MGRRPASPSAIDSNPPFQKHDLALAKRFRLSSEREIELVGTALNFVTHDNWNDPDAESESGEAPRADKLS